MQYWLLKSEPGDQEGQYSIDDIERDRASAWTGVRNYQARNFMSQNMRVGDLAFFYHSNSEPSGITGLVRVSGAAHPDLTAQDKRSRYYDANASKDKPVWECVDVEFVKKFPAVLPLAALRANARLAKMELLRKGSRLSIQPVRPDEFEEIMKMLK